MTPRLPLILLTLTALSGCISFAPRPVSAPAPAPVAAPVMTPAPMVQMTAKERLVDAIEANGCALTTDNVAAVLTDATISQEELLSLAPQLEAEGRAEVSGSGAIRVISDVCL